MSIQRSLAVLVGLAATASADVITSTFDAGAEGWLVADADAPDHQSITALAEHRMAGGNTGGFITTAISWPTTAFFVAPSEFLGDRSSSFGGSIEVDRRFIHPDSWADTMQVDYAVDLTMTGVGGTVTLAVGLAPVSLTQWESFSVDLSAAGGWFHVDTGVAATDAEIAGVLGSLDDLRIRGNVRDQFARVGIDNFSMVPAPGAAGLLALAGLGAIRRRR